MASASEVNLTVEAKVAEDSLSSSGKDLARQTAEELVAKAIAPVKHEFLRPPPIRPSTAGKDANSGTKIASSNSIMEKKSKRQLKRERLQEQKSVLHLCPVIAKTGNVSSCLYSSKCRFSHDLDGFKAQKPADLEGNCPFMSAEVPCPHGLACRFACTHRDYICGEASNFRNNEMNGLSKDVQRILWKNKMKFSKADFKLKLLGLMHKGKANSKSVEEQGEAEAAHLVKYSESSIMKSSVDEDHSSEAANDVLSSSKGPTDEIKPGEPANLVNHVESSPNMIEEDNGNGAFLSDERGPPKRARSTVDKECCSDGLSSHPVSVGCGDTNSQERMEEEGCRTIEAETKADNVLSETDLSLKQHPREKKLIDFRGRLYLAPLTTVGNLPFRRVCKLLGADVTCGEMAMCTNLLQGQASEWALLRRHSLEDLFGVQICGSYPDTVARTVELIEQECTVDFIDINMGCPIDIIINKGAGSALLSKPMRMGNIIRAASGTVDTPITVKVRTGFYEGRNRIDSLITDIGHWGATAVTIHGRTRQQRYSKLADWDYIYDCSRKAPDDLQVLGNGDVFSYFDWNRHRSGCPKLSSCMIARGALIKPWIFTEIKEQRDWDISSGERLNILKDYVRFGLQHWGSDTKGVETTRHFLLEWLSYTHRYVPVGLLDVIPQRLNWRPPSYFGRDELETMMASDSAADWVRISEMLLGKVPGGFTFFPKHKSNAYDRPENG